MLQRAAMQTGDFDSGPETPYLAFLWANETEILRRDPRFPALLKSVNLNDVVDLPHADQ